MAQKQAIGRTLTPFFDVYWHILFLTPPSSPFALHLGKLLRRPERFLLWLWQEIQIMQAPTCAYKFPPLEPQRLTRTNIRSQSVFFAFSGYFSSAWEDCPGPSGDLNCVINLFISSWHECVASPVSVFKPNFAGGPSAPAGWIQHTGLRRGGRGCNLGVTQNRLPWV